MRIKSFLTVSAAVAMFALATSAGAADKPNFPRVGAYLIGPPHSYGDSNYAAKVAKLDVAVYNGWPGYGNNGKDLAASMKAVKDINPATKMILYQSINEQMVPAPNVTASLESTIRSSGWWAYTAGSGGNIVQSAYSASYLQTNVTPFSPVNSSGQNYLQWRAKWEADTFYKNNPYIDGYFVDNVFYKPRVDADWNRDGRIDSQNDATTQSWYRQGYVDYFKSMSAQLPAGKFRTGNIADWGHPDADITQFKGMVDGGAMEYMMGASYSVETWGGWKMTMDWYKKTMAAVAEPKLVLFHVIGSATDYRYMRYALATCLMDEAYFNYSVNDDSTTVAWFDEYDVDLGKAVQSPQTAAWQNGVWRRDFEGGIVLLNPKGNGQKTITLEGDFQRISGKQDTSVNNGQTTRSITLQDRDAIVLKRVSSLKRPAAPTGVSIQ